MTKQIRPRRQGGFSLIELLVVVLLLSIVVGALFSQIERAQIRYRVEDQRLDLTQQQREFIDQFTRDLHQAGYPTANMYTTGVNANLWARGILSISPTDVQLEGDTEGDGQVYTVEYSYFDGAGWPGPSQNPCPCIRRSSLVKGSAGPATTFTEVQGVITTSDAIFAAYNSNGGLVPLPASASDLKTIKTVRITLTTQGSAKDNDTRKDIQVTMTGMARLVNN
jgi:prepilin-type N-terminal cleavage/methylation domain-containing protein